MTRLFRQICVGLAVTIVVALQAHGVLASQHRAEHSVQFPGVAYADMSMIEHAHGDDHHHEPEGASPAVEVDDASTVDAADSPDGAPTTHHHHGGGDIHVALFAPPHPLDESEMSPVNLGPARGTLPPGAIADGPTHPPRQLRA